jgi:predicted nucleic acid-binding protein
VKYALDTNIFIDAFRDTGAEATLLAFLARALPLTFLSAVVMQELAAGARTSAQARELERSVFKPFARRQRVFTQRSARLSAADAFSPRWRREKAGQRFTTTRRSSTTRCSRRPAANAALRSSRKMAISSDSPRY